MKNKRKAQGRGTEYLVEWKGNWPDDWNLEADLQGTADDAIAAFLAGHNNSRPKRKKKK